MFLHIEMSLSVHICIQLYPVLAIIHTVAGNKLIRNYVVCHETLHSANMQQAALLCVQTSSGRATLATTSSRGNLCLASVTYGELQKTGMFMQFFMFLRM